MSIGTLAQGHSATDSDSVIDLSSTYIPTERQTEAHIASERYILYGGAIGGGKCQPADCQVITSAGIQALGNLQIGDQVCSPDGSLSQIEKLSPFRKYDKYILHLANGIDIIANDEHLWYGGWRRDKSDFCALWDNPNCIKTTLEIKEYLEKPNRRSEKFRIPLPNAVEFDWQLVPIDPYLLGMLLGDGCITNRSYDFDVIKITTADIKHVRSYTDAQGIPSVCRKNTRGDFYDLILKNDIGNSLDSLCLLGTYSATKFIPECYKINSKAVRLAVLQGLMDTDGCIDSNNSARFYSTSNKLAEDVAFIARSLGYYASVRKRAARIREKYIDYKGEETGPYQCSDCYSVYISAMDMSELFRLERKKAKGKKRQKPLTVSVDSVEKTGRRVEMRCIKVSNPNGLYLTNGFTPTHNTVMLCNEGIQLSLDFPGNRGFIFRWENKTLKNTTLLTLQSFLPANLIARHHLSEQYYDLITGSRIYYGGLKPSGRTDPTDRLKSMDLGWFGVDEAHEIPEDVFMMLASRLRPWPGSPKGIHFRGILTSNPEPGWLNRRFIEKVEPNHKFIPAKASDNPHLPPDYEAGLRLLFPPDWVKRYLEGSWEISLEGNYVFPYAWIRAAIERNLDRAEPVEMGIDFAVGGGNYTVVNMRWGPVSRKVHKSSHRDSMKTAGIIAGLIDEHRPDKVRMDALSVGKGAFDRLVELGYDISPYVSGIPAKDPKRFFNQRAEDHWHVRDLMETGELDLEDEQILASQLAKIKYIIRSDKQIQIQTKGDMKSLEGLESPDEVDATVSSFAEDEAKRRGKIWIPGKTDNKSSLQLPEARRRQPSLHHEPPRQKRKAGQGRITVV